ncbi:carbohydrate esterase family 3 protein [Hypoxylon sp. FL1150]|nr:carbohydrate esterase family 3 protein [Hypoxylon sp. FL1150]
MRSFWSFLSLYGALLATSSTLVSSSPLNHDVPLPTVAPVIAAPIPAHTAAVITEQNTTLTKRSLVDLRILPLGASIVWGLESSDGNGFRLPLRSQLRYEGYNVNMVGTLSHGTMKDNDVEATPGYVITQIHTSAESCYAYKPNVVVINAGTNDCVDDVDTANAYIRLQSMIEDLWTNIGNDTVIIMSTILINAVESINTCSTAVNEDYRSLVSSLQADGRPIYLTEFDDWITIDDIGSDGTHPTDTGYKRMAGAFYATIAEADQDGAIKAPQDADLDTETTDCDKTAGTGVSAGAETQTGSGYDDGIYYHDSEAMGTILTITSDWDRNQWVFARLFSQDRDDLLGWISESDGSITYAVWRNDGDGVMTKINDMTNFPNQCIPRGLRFIDLNGDGLDDFVCISNPDGALYGVINNGDGSGSDGPSWTSIGLIKDADSNFPQAQVRLADIDGDGRADFVGLDSDGTAHVWRNAGTGDTPSSWQSLGAKWTGGDQGNLTGVRFEDINGDGRDDWMWMSNAGTTYTYTNSRSCRTGVEGDGLNVAWRQGFYTGESSGPTHKAEFDGDVNINRIHFARIYGETEGFPLLGRQDYVYMEHSTSGDSHIFEMKVWKNTGQGGAKLKADGDKYGNMMGTGRMDYVWTYSFGKMIIFRNGGVDYISSGTSYWTQPQEDLFDPSALIGKDLDRRDLHLTDFDGDGKDDIVWVDPDNDNHVSVFINQYDGTTWSWDYQSDPAPGLSCSQTKGMGIHDIPIRWGDISGNGRDDYVCIEPDGRMSGYVHETDGSWTYNEQFFGTKGYDRANFRFGDVNGDGKDDIIWTEKFSGDGYVYYNDGPMDIAGSSYHWDVDSTDSPAYAFAGNAAGSCTYYPDLNGDGRVDQHVILESFNNIAWTSYNLCSSGDHTGDDEDPYTDPDLPIPSGIDVSTGSQTSGCHVADASGDAYNTIVANFESVACSMTGTQTATGLAFQTVDCSNPAVTNADQDQSDRWSAVDADTAVEMVLLDYFYEQDDTTLTFPEYVSNYFEGPEGMNCGKMADSVGCEAATECDDVNHPAGYFILNSFVTIHGFLWDAYESTYNAESDMQSSIDLFSSTFAKVDDPTIAIDEILSVVGLLYALTMVPLWGKFWEEVIAGKENKNWYTLVKDSANALVDKGLVTIKQADPWAVTDNNNALLSYYMGQMINSTAATLSQTNTDLFNGSASSVADLYRIMDNGKLMESTSTSGDIDAKEALENSLYSVLIPYAWSLSNENLHPVVIDTGYDCSDTYPSYFHDYVSEDTASATAVCYNDSLYYLLDARDCNIDCSKVYPQGSTTCAPTKFYTPVGIDELDGSTWGAVTVENLTIAAINGFTNNDNANGWSHADPTNADDLNRIWADGINTGGVNTIPVCDLATAMNNWITCDVDADNYPCNS